MRTEKSLSLAWRVSLTYSVVAVVWILVSDWVVAALWPRAEEIVSFQTYKGLFFVLASAGLLFAVVQRAERRRERERLRRSVTEEQLRKLSLAVEQSPVSVVITDLAGNIEYVNPKFTAVTGHSPDEVIGKNPRILKSGEMAAEAYQQLWSEISRGRTWSGELHNRKKNGELYWERATISPIFDAQGRRTHYVAVKEEITERRQMEAALRRSEENFRLLFENASDLVTVIDVRGFIRLQSPSVKTVLGYEPKEVEGRSAFEWIHPDDAAGVVAALKQAATDVSRPVSVELRFRHKDGSWHILASTGRGVPGNAPEGLIIVNSRDITTQRSLEEQYRQMQKMEGIGQLAGGVAHDFNNLLAAIQMQSDLLKVSGQLSPAQAEYVAEIGRTVERAANLTRQLLLFGRRQHSQPVDLDLNEAVRNLAKMLHRILGEDIRLELSFAPTPPIIHADPGMLDQILVNLTVNSRDAMPQGGRIIIETAVVELSAAEAARSPRARPGMFACLTVTDSGCGIAPEILPRVFEPFFTTKDVGKGTGLGLATVFGIVQQHQGWVDVTSEVGRGSTFRVYLPVRARKPVAVNGAKPAADSIPGGSETILLVEDETTLRLLVETMLTQLGYRVIEAENGVQAMKVWQARRDEIDLLLTDMVMPDGISGRELAARLQADKPSLKVVYTSGYSPDLTGTGLSLREGVNFLPKPFRTTELGRTVRACLASRPGQKGGGRMELFLAGHGR